jgi:hypothetical protein
MISLLDNQFSNVISLASQQTADEGAVQRVNVTIIGVWTMQR